MSVTLAGNPSHQLYKNISIDKYKRKCLVDCTIYSAGDFMRDALYYNPMLSNGMLVPIPLPQDNLAAQTDHETALITSLSRAMSKAGFCVSQADLVNFYVALKSKPLAILASPGLTGETNLIQSLAHSIVGKGCLRVQLIPGHPWWAEGSSNIAQSTDLHERFVTEKVLSIIEEATQPENAQKAFIACLTQISPAELLSFFTEVAYQLQHGQIMRIGDTHLTEPIPLPPNVFMIGTMDTAQFDWWNEDLLSNTTVIQWTYTSVPHKSVADQDYMVKEEEFLQSCNRNRDFAYHKIYPVLKQYRHPLFPLMHIQALLSEHTSEMLERVTDEVMIYLSNSWSRLGNGLFHHSPERNLSIALDMAISQIILPRAVEAIQKVEVLREQLINTLKNQFPRSTAFVTEHALPV